MIWKNIADNPVTEDIFLWAYPNIFDKSKLCIDIGDNKNLIEGKDSKYYHGIHNSIHCPYADPAKSFWAPIPADDHEVWTKFNIENHDYRYDEVIFKLYNGSVYCGYIGKRFAKMAINPSRFVSIDCVDRWMQIPKAPDTGIKV